MTCPTCGAATKVTDSRPVGEGRHASRVLTVQYLRRRRECLTNPEHRFTTHETVVNEGTETALALMETRLSALALFAKGLYSGNDEMQAEAMRSLCHLTREDVSTAAGLAPGYLAKVAGGEYGMSEAAALNVRNAIIRLAAEEARP